jgi:hypothetical protein
MFKVTQIAGIMRAPLALLPHVGKAEEMMGDA